MNAAFQWSTVISSDICQSSSSAGSPVVMEKRISAACGIFSNLCVMSIYLCSRRRILTAPVFFTLKVARQTKHNSPFNKSNIFSYSCLLARSNIITHLPLFVLFAHNKFHSTLIALPDHSQRSWKKPSQLIIRFLPQLRFCQFVCIKEMTAGQWEKVKASL